MAVRTQKEHQVDIPSAWKGSKNKCQSHWNIIITMWICLWVLVHLIQVLHLAVIIARNFRRRCKKSALESVMKSCSAWRSHLNTHLKKASDLKIGVTPVTPIASPNVIRPDILVANRSWSNLRTKGWFNQITWFLYHTTLYFMQLLYLVKATPLQRHLAVNCRHEDVELLPLLTVVCSNNWSSLLLKVWASFTCWRCKASASSQWFLLNLPLLEEGAFWYAAVPSYAWDSSNFVLFYKENQLCPAVSHSTGLFLLLFSVSSPLFHSFLKKCGHQC